MDFINDDTRPALIAQLFDIVPREFKCRDD